MQAVLKDNPGEEVRAYIVWLPMFAGDTRARAQVRMEEFSDERVRHFWDGERLTGAIWQRVLDIGRLAWDVYFLYDPDAGWEREPAAPDFWMHQLGGVDKGLHLDRTVFSRQLKEMLAAATSDSAEAIDSGAASELLARLAELSNA